MNLFSAQRIDEGELRRHDVVEERLVVRVLQEVLVGPDRRAPTGAAANDGTRWDSGRLRHPGMALRHQPAEHGEVLVSPPREPPTPHLRLLQRELIAALGSINIELLNGMHGHVAAGPRRGTHCNDRPAWRPPSTSGGGYDHAES